MLNSKFYLAGIFLVLFCTAGFSGSYISDSAPESDGYSDVVTSHTVLPLSMESVIVLINTKDPKVCILRGNATEDEKKEFEECIADSDCGDWKRYEDSENGNVAAVCEPT